MTSTADYATAGVAFLNDVRTVLGVYPGNAIDENHQPFMVSESKDTLNAHFRVFTMEGTALETFKNNGTVENDYLTVNVLLNTLNATNNYKYYHTGDNAAYCSVTYAGEVSVPAIVNNTTHSGYTDLATAVEEASAGDVLTLNEDATISGSRLEIKKELTIQGATGEEKIICAVPANQLMVLANFHFHARIQLKIMLRYDFAVDDYRTARKYVFSLSATDAVHLLPLCDHGNASNHKVGIVIFPVLKHSLYAAPALLCLPTEQNAAYHRLC